MAPKVVGPVKRARLTLSQLASYDDILTDALVDHVYFWTTIRKNRAKYNLTRGFSEDQVTDILRNDLIVGHDLQNTEKQLLELPGIRRFVERLKTKKEREDFKRHLRKYINVWSNDCPFEIATSNRYTIVSHEAAAVARRTIEKGETIKYLCGNLVAMTPEEEKDLGLTRRDFSIVMSSRKKTPSLFLGPARFANHDCRANARLVTTGPDGMQVVALRKIETNEEITVTYGEDYFGIDNCECLCKTCELAERNGWAKLSTNQSVMAATLEEDPFASYSLRRSRRLSISGTSTPKASTPEVDTYLKRRRSESVASTPKRSKLNIELTNDLANVNPRPCNESSEAGLETHERHVTEDSSPSHKVRQHLPTATDSNQDGNSLNASNTDDDGRVETPGLPQTDAVPRPASAPLTEEDSSLKGPTEKSVPAPVAEVRSIPLLKPEFVQISVEPSDNESVFDHTTFKPSHSLGDTPPSLSVGSCLDRSEHDLSHDEEPPQVYDPQHMHGSTTPVPDVGIASQTANMFHLGDVASSATAPTSSGELGNSDQIKKRKRRAYSDPQDEHGVKALLGSNAAGTKLLGTAGQFDVTLQQRERGDYVRTPVLLSAAYSRWVDCRTCTGTWVQADGYTTRRECPRCERHSKLYGYQWPKTEPGQLSWVNGHPVNFVKKGKKRFKADDNDEERILDHRTVHRFIGASQEKVEHRKGRGLEPPGADILAALAACLKQDESESSEEDEIYAKPKRGQPKNAGKKGSVQVKNKSSAKGNAVALRTKKAGFSSKSHILAQTKFKVRHQRGRKPVASAAVPARRRPGRPKGSKNRVRSGDEKRTQSRKSHDIYDLPSDSDEELPTRKKTKALKKVAKTSKSTKALKATKTSKAKTTSKATRKSKVLRERGWKERIESTDDEDEESEEDFEDVEEKKPDTKRQPKQPKQPKPKPKPGWRGWVEVNDPRPPTVEEEMFHPTATGTRRGTQLGRYESPAKKRKLSAKTSRSPKKFEEAIPASSSSVPPASAMEQSADDDDVDMVEATKLSNDLPPEGGLELGGNRPDLLSPITAAKNLLEQAAAAETSDDANPALGGEMSTPRPPSPSQERLHNTATDEQ